MLCSTVYLLFEKGPGCVCVEGGRGSSFHFPNFEQIPDNKSRIPCLSLAYFFIAWLSFFNPCEFQPHALQCMESHSKLQRRIPAPILLVKIGPSLKAYVLLWV